MTFIDYEDCVCKNSVQILKLGCGIFALSLIPLLFGIETQIHILTRVGCTMGVMGLGIGFISIIIHKDEMPNDEGA